MRQGIKVSIIITNYNYGRFLPKAIESSLNQTYQNVEVIVVDDDSTDNSREIIASYGDKIIPVYKQNGDHASTFNAGFAVSTGEIICFLDADDIFVETKVTEVVETFDHHPDIGWCFHALQQVNSQTGQVMGATRAFPNLKKDVSKVCDYRAQTRNGKLRFYAASTSGLSFRRSLLVQMIPMPEPLKQAADRYLTNLAVSLAQGYHLNRELTIQGIHDSNDNTGRQDKKAKRRNARNEIAAAYYMRTNFPEFSSFTNRILSRGISSAWKHGGFEADSKQLMTKYFAHASWWEKILLVLMTLYQSRPWKKTQFYRPANKISMNN